jgi:2-dehydropantoate 2-reductase
MARIGIIGAGAIGGVVASLLQSTGKHELVLCLRRRPREIVVESSGGSRRIEAEILTDPQQAKPVDWVLIATKAYDAEAAAKWLDGLCATGAPVAVLQSGLGREFVELFAGSEADAAAVEDWTTVAWKKLCHNAVGALPALLLKPAGVLREEAIGQVALEMLRECIAVGRAEGAELPDSFAAEVLAACRRANPDSINSLHADRLAGRPMETAARNGAIVRKGREHGIPTPANAMAVALLEEMAKG